MWFGVLGSLLVRHGDVVIDVPAPRHRALLAALLLRAGTAVPVDTLAELVWDGARPPGAETTLRSHVSRLRQVLGPDVGARVVTHYRGYLIEAGEEEVDLLRFGALCRKGAAAARNGEWARAWEPLDEALGLWRGTPLADVPGDLLHRAELPGLEELRLQAMEWHADAGLGQGRHAELAARLQALTTAHPLRERFHAQLMLAHYRCGRQAEALAAYQNARQALAETLGADPGTELRDLHQRILTADPSLDLPRPPESVSLPEDNAPVVSGPSAGPPGRESRSRGTRVTRVVLAVAALAIATITALSVNAVSGSAHVPSPAAPAVSLAPGSAARIHWQCGPVVHATRRDGSGTDQNLRACIAYDHGHLDLEGVLTGSVAGWKERIILVLKHPRQPTYGKYDSPVCIASICVYQVAVNPGPGPWWAIPQWKRTDGGYQSTGWPSPDITISPRSAR